MKKIKVIEHVQAYLIEELVTAKSERAAEIQKLLLMYKYLPVREFNQDDVVCPAALVELEVNGTRAFYFVVPHGGGLIANVEGQPVQVITPQSPMGEAMLGKKVGDAFEVQIRENVRKYRVISIS